MGEYQQRVSLRTSARTGGVSVSIDWNDPNEVTPGSVVSK